TPSRQRRLARDDETRDPPPPTPDLLMTLPLGAQVPAGGARGAANGNQSRVLPLDGKANDWHRRRDAGRPDEVVAARRTRKSCVVDDLVDRLLDLGRRRSHQRLLQTFHPLSVLAPNPPHALSALHLLRHPPT